jgi:hypothetical protein
MPKKSSGTWRETFLHSTMPEKSCPCSLQSLQTFSLKNFILKSYKRDCTSSYIGQTFWLDWPESLARAWQHYDLTFRAEGKLLPENFPAGLFLRKADKCFGIYIAN